MIDILKIQPLEIKVCFLVEDKTMFGTYYLNAKIQTVIMSMMEAMVPEDFVLNNVKDITFLKREHRP